MNEFWTIGFVFNTFSGIKNREAKIKSFSANYKPEIVSCSPLCASERPLKSVSFIYFFFFFSFLKVKAWPTVEMPSVNFLYFLQFPLLFNSQYVFPHLLKIFVKSIHDAIDIYINFTWWIFSKKTKWSKRWLRKID